MGSKIKQNNTTQKYHKKNQSINQSSE